MFYADTQARAAQAESTFAERRARRIDEKTQGYTYDYKTDIYGEDAALNPKNIIESGKFQITTPEVKIAVAPEYSYMIEARVIDGRKYILIPADEGVEVNGIAVNIPNSQNRESC